MISTVCPVCSVAFLVRPTRLRRSKNVCCSRECSSILRKTTMKGSNNHQYGLRGSLNSTWKSDVGITNLGYLAQNQHTNCTSRHDGSVLVHRSIVEEHLKLNDADSDYLSTVQGQHRLSQSVDVHHIDENKLNFKLANLLITTRGEHTSMHNKMSPVLKGNDGRFISTYKTDDGHETLTKKNNSDAGLDIHSAEDVTIKAGGSTLISTKLSMAIPEGFAGLIWSRSGLSVKNRIEVGAGCIDAGYRGEVKVHLYNYGTEDFEVSVGDRIAQLLTVPLALGLYEQAQELPEADRGNNGFGSSGGGALD